jgi:ribosomal protein S18 acetylase RimI-like enzyme
MKQINDAYTLRTATMHDFNVILGWISSPEALAYWGGPLPTWPPDPRKTWGEIQNNDPDSFTLVDSAGTILAFGQVFKREPGAVHLGRIIVSPEQRGKGIGRILVGQLIDAGIARHQPTKVTLNVYRDNQPAVKLYKSLGFEVVSEDAARNSYGMCLKLDGK